MTTTRKVLIAEAVLVLGIFVYLYVSFAPTGYAPLSGQSILEPNFVFEIGNGEIIILSSSPDFSNPITLTEGSEVDLPVGTYYWKVKNWFRESDVKTFTLESNVGIDVIKGINTDRVQNSGTVPVDVKEKNSGITTGISVGDSVEVEKGGEFEGTQS